MDFKFIVAAAVCATARAGVVPQVQYAAAPVQQVLQYASASATPIVQTQVAYAAPAPAPQIAYAQPTYTKLVTAPVQVAASKAVVPEEYDPNPQYSYGYNVQDNLTGDNKAISEIRNGDVVQGSYTVIDPDGTKRTVRYTADPIHGFNAVVHREPVEVKAVAKVVAPAGHTYQ